MHHTVTLKHFNVTYKRHVVTWVHSKLLHQFICLRLFVCKNERMASVHPNVSLKISHSVCTTEEEEEGWLGLLFSLSHSCFRRTLSRLLVVLLPSSSSTAAAASQFDLRRGNVFHFSSGTNATKLFCLWMIGDML